jgi:xanthine dehydrogenase YagR molybdenum-binding subunit
MAALIGEPIDRIDGPAKVTGKAIYAADQKEQKLAFGAIATA